MLLSRWMLLIGVVVGLGCLQVAQRNAIFLKGYAVGDRIDQVHTQETEVSWLGARVVGLESPTRLSQLAQERHLKLVAWSMLPPSVPDAEDGGRISDPLTHLASLDPAQPTVVDETSD